MNEYLNFFSKIFDFFGNIGKSFYKTVIYDNRYEYIFEGLFHTIIIALFAVIIGIVIGILVSLIRNNYEINGKNKLLYKIANLYVNIIRGTPVILQLMIIYYVIFKSVNINIVIVVNKWDLVEKETNSIRDFEKAIKDKIALFNDVPILFVSALTKQRILKAVETAMAVNENRKKRIKTNKLNEILLPIIEQTPPPAINGK